MHACKTQNTCKPIWCITWNCFGLQEHLPCWLQRHSKCWKQWLAFVSIHMEVISIGKLHNCFQSYRSTSWHAAQQIWHLLWNTWRLQGRTVYKRSHTEMQAFVCPSNGVFNPPEWLWLLEEEWNLLQVNGWRAGSSGGIQEIFRQARLRLGCMKPEKEGARISVRKPKNHACKQAS